MGQAPVESSKIIGRLLRERRVSMGLTLAEVSGRLAASGHPIPTSTLAAIESGRRDAGTLRLNRLIRLYDIPPHLVTDLAEIEDLAADVPESTDIEALHKKGIRAFEKGNIGEGLGCVIAVRGAVGASPEQRLERQKSILSFAVMAAHLGKIRLAKELLGELMCEPPERSIASEVLIQAAEVWAAIGATDAALAFLTRAETLGHAKERKGGRPVTDTKARLFLAAGQFDDAQQAVNASIQAYRRAKDTAGEARSLLLLGSIAMKAGRMDEARGHAKKALAFAEARRVKGATMMARLLQGRIRIASGDVTGGVVDAEHALADAIRLQDPQAQFYGHYTLWKAYERLGQTERASLEAQSADYFAQRIDDSGPEATDTRAWAAAQPRPGKRGGRKLSLISRARARRRSKSRR